MNADDRGHAIGHGEPFTMEQNDEVYKRLVKGDKKARDEMIEGNVALVVYRVEAYLRSAPQMTYYRDDMISAGLLGLCGAVDRMRKKGPVKNPKPTGCIAKAIDRHVSHAVDESNTIVVPNRVQQLARAEGEPITPPRIVPDKALIGLSESSSRDRKETLELTEDVLACCRNDVERRVVSMRVDGHTDAEIEKALNLTHVSRLRREIFKRFNERCPEYRETKRAAAKRLAKEAERAAKKAAKKVGVKDD